MEWSEANVLRFEDRGAGVSGDIIEPSFKQWLADTEDLDPATSIWTAAGAVVPTVAANAQTAFDGDVDADDVSFGAAADSRLAQAVLGLADSIDVTFTVRAWVASGTQTFRLQLLLKDGTTATTADLTATTTITQFRLTANLGVGATTPEVRLLNGTDAAARTVTLSMANLTEFDFVRSYVRSRGTKPADILIFPSVPDFMQDVGFRMDFYPYMADTEGDTQVLAWFGSDDNFLLYQDVAGSKRIRVRVGGVNILTTGTLAHSPLAKLTVICDLIVGSVSFAVNDGAPSVASGTPWTWPDGELWIGRAGPAIPTVGLSALFNDFIPLPL
jgi:hypothetical protein